MNTEPKSRQDKLVDAIFAYFGDKANELPEDAQTQRISSYLLTLGDELMGNHYTLSFIDLWNCEYAEEEEVTREEVLWALQIFNTSMSQKLQGRHQTHPDSRNTRPKLRVINGGLSAKPDRPYVAPEDIVEDYDLDS